MKKFLFLVLMFGLGISPAIAGDSSDVFDGLDTTNYADVTQNLKYFSEKDYQNAIQQYKNKFQKPKKVKKKDIKTPTSVYADTTKNPEFKVLEEIINHKGSIMIPTVCITETGQEIYPGHYSLEYYTDKNNTEWLILSQGSRKIAKLPTHKSKANDKEDTINYAYAIGKDNCIKLLYGNIDVAVEAVLDVIN
ncbi:MAG: hypothetical protein ACI37T_09010 [Candidatus Gastranaerophilaceae bacterium]